MIEVYPVREIRPGWATRPATRYQSHPDLRAAVIQCEDDPERIWMVTDQKLPESIQEAVDMIVAWRAENERTQV